MASSHIYIPPSKGLEEMGVYEPAEDSFLMIDALLAEGFQPADGGRPGFLSTRFRTFPPAAPPPPTAHLPTTHHTLSSPEITRKRKRSPTPLVLEVGTGSGIVIAHVNANAERILGRRDVVCMAVDVNENAVRVAGRTVGEALRVSTERERHMHGQKKDGEDVGYEKDGGGTRWATNRREGQEPSSTTPAPSPSATAVFTDALLSNLTTAIRHKSVDVLIFNPPYVPTESVPAMPPSPTAIKHSSSEFEVQSQLLALTYAGGTDGMEITNQLLGQLDDVLSERGVAYILLCARNRPNEVMERVRREWGATWGVCLVRESGGRGGWERLSVVRLWRLSGQEGERE